LIYRLVNSSAAT